MKKSKFEKSNNKEKNKIDGSLKARPNKGTSCTTKQLATQRCLETFPNLKIQEKKKRIQTRNYRIKEPKKRNKR